MNVIANGFNGADNELIIGMNSMFLSYIVPCYNIEEQLPKCIESLERQHVEGHDLEFIMVNDGSKDDTLKIIRQFAERDRRVVVLDQENQGVCAARNNALNIAKGEYVFFLDGDDFLTDDASQKMFEACSEKMPDILLMNNYKITEGSPESARLWIDFAKFIKPGIYGKNDFLAKAKRIPISFKLYNLKFLKANGILFDKELRVGEVYTFFIHCLVLADTIGVSHVPAMYYLKRAGESATTSVNYERDLTILDTLHILLSYVDKHKPELRSNRAFLSPLFFMVTGFYLIKYVSRIKYNCELGKLMNIVKQDDEYRKLLVYFTGVGAAKDKFSLLAFTIRYLPTRLAYDIIRLYYKYATRNRE